MNATVKTEPKIIMHTWYIDKQNRTWVILYVLPFLGEGPKESIEMLELGKSEFITRPYQEVIDLVKKRIFQQITI